MDRNQAGGMLQGRGETGLSDLHVNAFLLERPAPGPRSWLNVPRFLRHDSPPLPPLVWSFMLVKPFWSQARTKMQLSGVGMEGEGIFILQEVEGTCLTLLVWPGPPKRVVQRGNQPEDHDPCFLTVKVQATRHYFSSVLPSVSSFLSQPPSPKVDLQL